MADQKRKVKKSKGRSERIMHEIFEANAAIIPGPQCDVSMTLPEDHSFVIFMKGEDPFVPGISEPGDWTFSGENLTVDVEWPAVAMALPTEFVENYLHLVTPKIVNDIVDDVQYKHRKMLN